MGLGLGLGREVVDQNKQDCRLSSCLRQNDFRHLASVYKKTHGSYLSRIIPNWLSRWTSGEAEYAHVGATGASR